MIQEYILTYYLEISQLDSREGIRLFVFVFFSNLI